MGIYSDYLLTVDFDRTLTAPDSSIPQRNLEAIRYFIDNGGAFTVNTGRSLPMARIFANQVPVNAPLLLYNGSAAYDLETETLSSLHEIPLDMWETVLETARMFPNMVTEIQGLDAHYLFKEDPMWAAFTDHNQCARGYAKPGTDLGPFLKFSVYGQVRNIMVSNFYEGDEEELRCIDYVERTLLEKYGESVEVFRSAPRILDIHAKGISKSRAARELQQRLGRKTLVCVGDGENDISMLSDADYAWCPSDSIVADRFPTVCSCGEGAVADVIYKKIPALFK